MAFNFSYVLISYISNIRLIYIEIFLWNLEKLDKYKRKYNNGILRNDLYV
jgi:hypothetical protein